jgi:outer membrane protein
MKKKVMFAFTILTMSLLILAEVKIGVINAQQVIMNTKKGKEVTARLEKLGQGKQKKVESMRREIKKLEKDLVSPALNTQTRESKTLNLQRKRTDLKRYIEDAQKEMQLKSQKELNELRKDIMPVIEKIGKEKGFTLILDLSTAGIAYFDRTVDVTKDVIAAYDKKYQSTGN